MGTGAVALAGSGSGVTGKVRQARYHGHDALIAVDVAEAGLLQVRALGHEPPAPDSEVGLVVSGPVTAWLPAPAGPAGASAQADEQNPQGTV